ncbi:MAG: sulfite exporter TauE/SafE family protein [Candidatus Aminicenantes bacterium]|jgi:uncharacterized membrane protein YfcA
MFENILFIFISYLAAIAATLAGFGSSTLLVPVAVHFMDVRTAVFIVACFHLFNNLFKVRLFWKKIELRTFLLFGIPSIAFAFIGAYFISVLPVQIIVKVLGVFLIIYAVFSLIKPRLAVKKSKWTAIAGGSLSGLLAGLIGLGGAIRGAFLVTFNLAKEIYVGTSAAIAMVIDLTRIPTYIFTGTARMEGYSILLLFLIASAYFGVRTGKALLNRINQDTFRRIVSVALLLVGIKILI